MLALEEATPHPRVPHGSHEQPFFSYWPTRRGAASPTTAPQRLCTLYSCMERGAERPFMQI